MFTNELKLIQMVQDLQASQSKYRYEKMKYGNSSTQLEICKKKERELKSYMNDRLKQIEEEKKNQGKQHQLF